MEYKESYNTLMNNELTTPFAPAVQRFYRFFDRLSDLDIETITV